MGIRREAPRPHALMTKDHMDMLELTLFAHATDGH
jgi:hypothetical protein